MPPAPLCVRGIEARRVRAADRADQRPDLTIDGTAADGLQVWFQPREKEKTIAKGRAAERLAGACAGEMAGLLHHAADGAARLGNGPCRPRTSRCWSAGHHQAETVKQALAARGIAAIHQSRQSVFASREAEELGPHPAGGGGTRRRPAAAGGRAVHPADGAQRRRPLPREMQQGGPGSSASSALSATGSAGSSAGCCPCCTPCCSEEGVIARVFATGGGAAHGRPAPSRRAAAAGGGGLATA
ncbi:MAG: hypothetical protein U5L11_14110 [Arhodomonas sp.]|nr:hypothetical protein [Arhodomonas sp.]